MFSEDISLYIFLAVLLVAAVLFLLLGLKIGRVIEAADWKGHKLEDTVAARLKQSRSVIGGLVTEQVAPYLPGFPCDPGDCRFVGKPVDFIVFNGMNKKSIDEVIFVEVKTGGSGLNEQEKRLKDAVQNGRVRWEEVRL
jgi:predicted Holliday junction resolvase-like endonuclease